MEEEKLLKATHQGKLNIGEKELTCAVLNDGTRVLTSTAIFKAFDRPRKGKGKESYRVTGVPSFMDAKNLEPYIQKHFGDGTLYSVQYMNKSGNSFEGYKAEILPIICDIYLEARQDNALTSRQQPLALASEILVRSLSKVGIIALIDEATGYQEEREKDELQKILAKYISAELLPWTKRFPDEFYKEMFRLKKWSYKGNPKPGIVGKITKEIVYDMLPPGVIDELQNKNPVIESSGRRKYKHHQYLTQETGAPHLDKHLLQLVTLMKISDTWKQFEKLFKRAFNIPDQIEFDFENEEQKQ